MCLPRLYCMLIKHKMNKELKSRVFYTGVIKRVDPPLKFKAGFKHVFTPQLTDRSSNRRATTTKQLIVHY